MNYVAISYLSENMYQLHDIFAGKSINVQPSDILLHNTSIVIDYSVLWAAKHQQITAEPSSTPNFTIRMMTRKYRQFLRLFETANVQFNKLTPHHIIRSSRYIPLYYKPTSHILIINLTNVNNPDYLVTISCWIYVRNYKLKKLYLYYYKKDKGCVYTRSFKRFKNISYLIVTCIEIKSPWLTDQ